ncbi:DUF2207 domain-containing protein [Anaerosalibacter massiliensis]|uniref:DUF2207 domain-containing protein n=1 Tax=Anaerosalibacter massiliensis TaxID=1347392 RepID=A0A9X2MHB5_9FIRM|nr:DUF2207 domain-containing protein [Anaerosalibacter massiliensis]MCR2043639.1 DUF2207 domain-containing protein [Anaerosalibacter massiliensis]
MCKIENFIKKISIVSLIFIVLLSFPLKIHADDSISISRWLIESELLENGDLYIEEYITFDLTKKFNNVFREIVFNKYNEINNIKVYEILEGKEIEYGKTNDKKKADSGVFDLETNKNKKIIYIYSHSKGDKKTFKIQYTIKNLAKKYKDTGELKYQFLGEDNEIPIDFFSVNIKLPQNKDNRVKVFSHGPLNSTINFKDENLIHIETEDIPKNTFIEGRVLFPNKFIPKSSNSSDQNVYDKILNEENNLIKEMENKKIQKNKIIKILTYTSLITTGIGIIGLILLISILRRKVNVHEKINSNIIPEDITPAVACYLTLSYKNINIIIATILDLVRKNYLKIEEKPANLNIIKVENENDQLLEHEVFFINWIINNIGTGNSVDIESIGQYSRNYSDKFLDDFNTWQSLAKKETEKRGYFNTKVRRCGHLLAIISFIFFIISIATLAYGVIYGLFPLIISIITFIYGLTLLSRKTDEGHIEYKKWKKFIKHMKNTKKIDITEEYLIYPLDMTLIYALAFGIDKNLLYKFKNSISDIQLIKNPWMYWCLFSENRNILYESVEKAFKPVLNHNNNSIGNRKKFSKKKVDNI